MQSSSDVHFCFVLQMAAAAVLPSLTAAGAGGKAVYFEGCVDSVASAVAAQNGGAHRYGFVAFSE